MALFESYERRISRRNSRSMPAKKTNRTVNNRLANRNIQKFTQKSVEAINNCEKLAYDYGNHVRHLYKYRQGIVNCMWERADPLSY